METKNEQFEPPLRKWWLATSVNGMSATLEIVETPSSAEAAWIELPNQEIKEGRIGVDRGVLIIQNMGPRGIQVSLAEIRSQLGAIYMPQDGDYSKEKNRRRIYFSTNTLFSGPYMWVDVTHPENEEILGAITKVYSPPQAILVPEKGKLEIPGKNAPPGALDALGSLLR